MKRVNDTFPFLSAFLLLCGILSCRMEQDRGLPEEEVRAHAHFSLAVDDVRDVVRTKTVLTDDSIETKITSVTVAVYSADGTLVGKKYLTAGFDDIRYMLGFDETFTVYAVANMGDMRAFFPSSITGDSSLEGMTYSIPGYTSGEDCIDARGIPMVGKLVYTTASEGSSAEGQIVMTRLMSKLQVHLACHWPGTFQSVKIYNLNRTLKPFGVSSAAGESDILDQQEIHVPEEGSAEGEFLFYLPENRQGDIPSVSSPEEKSRDNEAVTGADLKTYLEVVVAGNSAAGVNGTLTYRSYLGGNNSSDFNIVRNSRYVWSVDYFPGNLQNNDWKHDNALSWKEFEYSFSVPSYLYYRERNYASLTTYTNLYENGAFVQKKQDNSTGIPTVTYSVSPGDGSVLGDPSVSGSGFYFTGTGSGTGTVTATCVDPFHPEGVTLSGQVRVLDYGRELFLRTPSGDYYDGETVPVPYGATWNNLQVGMKKTMADGTVRTICPVVMGSDNLFTSIVMYPRLVGNFNNALVYYRSSLEGGKEVTFSHTFSEKQESSSPNRFILSCTYKDYNNVSRSMAAYITAEVLDVDAEMISVSADKNEAYWSGGSISLTARSVTVHNGTSGAGKDITGNDGYQWTVTGSAPGMNPQLALSGSRRVLTVSAPGSVTVTVTGKSDGAVRASASVTFKDKVTYRLNIGPKTRNVKVGDTFRTEDFTVRQDQYVNGSYRMSEPFQGQVYWSVKSGSASLLRIQSGTVTARAQGTGYLRAYTYSSLIESGYSENEVTVNIGQADHYTVSLSPASVTLLENERSQALQFEVRNNGVPVSGLIASDLVWHTRNSAVATVSGGVVSGKTAGSTKVYATYAGGTSNEIDVIVKAVEVIPQVSYRYKVVTAVNPARIRVGETARASAVLYKKTFEDGVAVTDWVADRDVTSGGFEDTGNSGRISISGSTLTAVASGSCTVRSLFQADEYEDAVLSVSDADYAVSILPSPGVDLILGKKTPQTYTASATRNGASFAGGTFEWSLSPSDRAGLSSASGPSVTVTPVAAGKVTLTVNLKVDGSVKASASVEFTVIDNPLQLGWSSAGVPVYVAQRGLLEVGGLDMASASVRYEVLSGTDKVRLVQNGKNTYVGLLAPGSYSIRATASNGQTGTFSGSVSAPVLFSNAATLYANPDGSRAHTGEDGLTGDVLSAEYKDGSATLSTTSDAIAVGRYLYKLLYDELLAPRYTLSAGSCLESDGPAVRVVRLSSPAYPSVQGTSLGTVTVSAGVESAGVTPVVVNIRSVNPFNGWSQTVFQPEDVEDWGLLKGYCSQGSHYNESVSVSAIRASAGRYGMKAFVNGEEACGDLQSVFRGDVNGGRITWSLSPDIFGGFTRHQAGDVVLKAYVQNSRSGEFLYHSFAAFRLFVHGAVGGRVVLKSSVSANTFQDMYMQAGFAGNVAGTPFAANGIYSVGSSIARWEGIDRSLGTCPFYVANNQEMANFSSADDYILNIIPGEKVGADSYRPAGSQLFVTADAEAFMMSTPPKLRWGTVQNPQLVKNGGAVLYLKSSSLEPGRTVDGVNDCGYYVLHLLGDIQTTGLINGNAGWVR